MKSSVKVLLTKRVSVGAYWNLFVPNQLQKTNIWRKLLFTADILIWSWGHQLVIIMSLHGVCLNCLTEIIKCLFSCLNNHSPTNFLSILWSNLNSFGLCVFWVALGWLSLSARRVSKNCGQNRCHSLKVLVICTNAHETLLPNSALASVKLGWICNITLINLTYTVMTFFLPSLGLAG